MNAEYFMMRTNTLQVEHQDTENMSLLTSNALWESRYHVHGDSLFMFSTGRSPTLYNELRKEKPMLTLEIGSLQGARSVLTILVNNLLNNGACTRQMG